MVDMRRDELDKKYAETASVSQFLMPYTYLADDQAFILADGSAARILECDMAPCSVRSPEDMESLAESIGKALARLDASSIFHAVLAPTSDIDDDLDNYVKNGGTNHYIIGDIEQNKVAFFRQTRSRAMFNWRHGDGSFLTRRFRLIIALTVVPDEAVGGIGASFMDAVKSLFNQVKASVGQKDAGTADLRTETEKRFADTRDRLLETLARQAGTVSDTLANYGIDSQPMPASKFIAYVRQMLYPGLGVEHVTWRPDIPLNQQIQLSDIECHFGDGIIKAGDTYHMLATLQSQPNATFPGMLSMPHNDSLGGLSLLDFLNNGFLCLSGVVIPKSGKGSVREYLDKRLSFIKGGAALPEQKDYLTADIELCRKWVEVDNRNIFFTQLCLGIHGADPKQAKARLVNVLEKMSNVGLDMRIEQHCAPALFFQTIPTNYAPNIPQSQRIHWLPDRAFADLLPIYGFGRGTRNASFLAHNRYGEPVRINVFDSNSNPHFVVCGASGSGKSFFINNLAADHLRHPEAQVLFVDKGGSYAKLTSILGDDGSFNPIGLKSSTCFNPCEGTLADSGAFLVELICHMITSSQAEKPGSKERAIINDCINRAYVKKQEVETYTTYAAARETRRKVWFHQIGKRFLMHRIDATELQSINAAKRQGGRHTPEFDIYHIARITGHEHTQWTEMGYVDDADAEWFASRKIALVQGSELYPGDSDRDGVYGLYISEAAEAAMRKQDYSFIPDDETMILYAATEMDLAFVLESGVELRFPRAYIEHRRTTIEAAIRADLERRGKAAREENIAEYVNHAVRDPDPEDYFAWTQGEMTVQNEVFLHDIANELDGYGDELATGIAERFGPYHGSGQYAGFFDGETGFELHGKKAICFDPDELSSAGEDIYAAVIGTLLHIIILYCQEPDIRGKPKMLILEEFWELLKVPLVADKVDNLYRTGRKFGLAIGAVSQLVTDFTGYADSEATGDVIAGRNIINGASFRFILRQPSSAINHARKTLNWTDERAALLDSVSTAKGLFSDVLYECTDIDLCDVLRLVPNAHFYWVATTDGADVRFYEETVRRLKMEENLSQQDASARALRECADRYPNGIGHG